jgi:hypothetical protein
VTELWDLARGAMATKALGVAADLQLADLLAEGPQPVAKLAGATGVEASTLHRVLRALASDGVFAEEAPGLFRNTKESERLRSDQRNGWPEFAHLFAGVFYDAVAEFPEKFEPDFWEWLAANPTERAAFDLAMAGGKERGAARVAELDWRAGETVVDVGGGNGALLRELLAHRPELRGIILDLPATDRDEAALGDRINFVPGNFFESVPEGDVYVLSAILHDWDDERAGAILRTVRAAAAPHARLLLLESVVLPGNEPQGAKWLDLLMLVLGGRERTEEDWRALLEAASFTVESVEDGLIQARCR